MKSLLFQTILILCTIACNQQGVKPSDSLKEKKPEIHIPPKVTFLSVLPDSLQPRITYLDKAPKPVSKTITLPPPLKIYIDSITGDPIPPGIQGVSFAQHFNTDNGLAMDNVYCVYIDHMHNLWFGTLINGVSRFDGNSFTILSTAHGLVNDRVWDITEDRKGNIWFATLGGVTKYDGNTITNYTTAQGLPSNDVGKILEDKDGNIWCTPLGAGMSKFDGHVFTNFDLHDDITSNDVWCMTLDHSGRLWIGLRGGGVLRYEVDKSGKESFKRFEGPESWLQDQICFIHEDRSGKMWFGTATQGVFMYDGNTFINYTSSDGLPCNYAICMLEDGKNDIWIGTCDGLVRFNGRSFENYSKTLGLARASIQSLAEDVEGNIWIATNSNGVIRYDGEMVTNFSSLLQNRPAVSIIEDEQENIWISTWGLGIQFYNGITYTRLTRTNGLSSNALTFLFEDRNGDFWFSNFGRPGGVNHLEFNKLSHDTLSPKKDIHQGKLTTYSSLQGMAGNEGQQIVEDKNGNIWIATSDGGVSRYDGKSMVNYTKDQGLPNNAIIFAVEDKKGNLWFGASENGGVSLFDGNSFTNFTTAQGLAANECETIVVDQSGNVWFGTKEGLSVVTAEMIPDNHTPETPYDLSFQTFGAADGLPDKTVYSIWDDHHGNLILGTKKGIAILKGGLNAFKTQGAIEIYNETNGYPFKDVTTIIKDSHGIIWAGSNSEKLQLVRFDLNSIHNDTLTPQVTIQDIQIDKEKISWYSLMPNVNSVVPDSNVIPAYLIEETAIFGNRLKETERDSMRNYLASIRFDSIRKLDPIPYNLTLPYRFNNITFEFNASIIAKNNLAQYQYFLEGYDKEWSPPSRNASATFGNIHEGSYTFKVKACNAENIWGEPTIYKFSVLPPLHRTWWAYSLYGALFLSMIYTGHRFQKQRTIRIEQEKGKQKQAILNERLRISRDLHDEVGATLSGIVMYSHLAKGQVKEGKIQAEQSINIVQESASKMVDKLNDVVWLVNPEKDTLGKLMEKLEEYATQTTSVKNMSLSFSVPENLENFTLPIEYRKNIYLFCKEAINNAVKYSEGTAIELNVNRSDHTLEFVIKDNGIGFDPQSVKRGNGLNNMQQRAEAISGEFSFSSNLGDTIITLKCKIPQLGYA